MKQGINALCLALLLGLALAMAGCSKKKEANKPQDLESVRASLREQVASGELTREEAVVKLAEATKEAKFGSGSKDKDKDKAKFSPALEALGEKLKEQVGKGDMTAEDAKAAWIKAALEAGKITEEEAQAKRQSTKQGTKDSAKETE